jgi:hypothetical protein
MKRFVRSPAEIRDRIVQKAFAHAERIVPSLFLADVSHFQLPAERDGNGTAFSFSPFLLGDAEAAFLRDRAAGIVDTEQILREAQQIVDGRVRIFGHGLVDVGRPPRWHEEPLAKIVAPRVHWQRIDYLDPYLIGDHKVLWEFNRHQYFITLAQAFLLTGDDRWAECIAADIRDWIRENPAGQGVNWASSLEVAYRAIAWCWVIRLAGHARCFNGGLAAMMSSSIAAHGRHISRYLSTWFSPNTHLTGEALGLLYIGHTFPHLDRASHWANLGTSILTEQLDRQVLEDGIYFEQATQYHRYTAEIYLHFLLLSKLRGQSVDRKHTSRIERLFDALLHLTRSDGSMPLIGDDDGGLLLPFDGKAPHLLNGLLATAAGWFNRGELLAACERANDHAVWFLNRESWERLDRLQPSQPEDRTVLFPDGGLCVMRETWTHESGHLTFDVGPHGAMSCGHSHADALAVELYAGGGPLFVDAGTFTYVGSERNAFRSTAYHNAVELDGKSASVPSAPFKWETRTNSRIDHFAVDQDVALVAGSHHGYSSPDRTVTISRTVFHPAMGVWAVEDLVLAGDAHQVALHWHLAPELSVSRESAGSRADLIKITRDSTHVVTAVVLSSEDGVGSIAPNWFSGQFGSRQRSSSCVWTSHIGRDAALITIVIDWTVVDAELVTLCSAAMAPITLRSPSPRSPRQHTLCWTPFPDMSSNASRMVWTTTSTAQSISIAAGSGLTIARGPGEPARMPTDSGRR